MNGRGFDLHSNKLNVYLNVKFRHSTQLAMLYPVVSRTQQVEKKKLVLKRTVSRTSDRSLPEFGGRGTFRRIQEALRVEWRSSTSSFASIVEEIKI